MKLHFILTYIIFSLLFSVKSLAQADISMATHWYNRANYNPSSIARTDYLYLFFNARQQWLGVEGAPKVLNVQASEYIHRLRSAFGFSLVSDVVGATKAYNPMLTYAFRISNKQDWSLSMGLSAGMFVRVINGSLYEATVDNDPSVNYSTEKTTRPDANTGIEFQNTHFIFGISSTHLLSIGKQDNLYLNTNHRYAYAIYKNNKSEFYNYSIGLQMVNRYNLTVLEGNISIRYKHQTGLLKGPQELFDLGLTYRTSQQMTLLLGVNISSNLRVGYAYDQSFISGYNKNGTHEIMLEYRIPLKAASPRYRCGGSGNWYH
jgi:type IX secretion system PorP/SprF family membrane protein